MKARDTFTLQGSHTLTVSLSEPYDVRRIAITYHSVIAGFDVTVKRKVAGAARWSEELTHTATDNSLIWVPSGLQVHNGDQLEFTSSVGDKAEVVIDYSNEKDT